MRRRSRILLLIFLLRILFVSHGFQKNTLAAGGSTAMLPIMSFWTERFSYHSYKISYEGVGSGTGISRLIDGVYAFAASDEYVPAELAKEYDLINIPILVQAFVFVVNMPMKIRLNATIIAEIYLGEIAYRDDPKIEALNHIDLPHKPIIAVHRKDASGTTAVITTRLSKNSAKRSSVVGSGDSVYWPVDDTGRGVAAIGNSGVAEAIKERPYSIGYVSYAWAKELSLNIVSLPNAEGEFVEPSINAFEEAVEAYKIPENYSSYVLDSPRGWPIVSLGYVVLYRGLKNLSPEAKEAVKAFLRYALTAGQEILEKAYFAKLPPKIVEKVLELLSSFRCF